MDTKLKRFSYSPITKTIAFILAIACFSIGIYIFIEFTDKSQGDLDIFAQDSYYESYEFISDLDLITENLISLIKEFKNEKEIKSGKTIDEDYLQERTESLFYEWSDSSKNYNPNLSDRENYKVFEEENKKQIEKMKNEQINDDLRQYNNHLNRLDKYEGILYYATNGEDIFTNISNKNIDYFKSQPSYLIYDKLDVEVYPKSINEHKYYNWFNDITHELNDSKNKLYIGFTSEYLNPKMDEWQERKELATDNVYKLLILGFIFLIALIYLIYSIGRKVDDDNIQLNSIDKIYNDIKVILAIALITTEIVIIGNFYRDMIYEIFLPITILIAVAGFLLVLSLIKHLKNRTLIKYSLTYKLIHKIFRFSRDVYDSGSPAIKVILIVIGYPLLVVGTFFMFPITIGFAIWLAFKKVNEFEAIKEGVSKAKDGDLNHEIDIKSNGEFRELAENINTITEGLNQAVENEVKSERLKTELISNVSHDIRTPLTSIITYVDLLKQEDDPEKMKEYIDVIDKKSQRLKLLTDDLFEASKANSGNIPVNYEKIDILSLITQGLGELNDKIKESKLEFKINNPKEGFYVKADGRLLWRSIENLFSNVFKYTLEGSRVYIDIEESKDNIRLAIKNISAYELNISPDELMERFKRGDESRHSPGSGLGLSIAKSLIELQDGIFNIEIDGDLFKVILELPKYN
ncbi:HAMP domain-containing histidine kinase [Clostridium sp. D2Q-14]|uniref:sensor histidine kinase n=1 Tax=Anaeromonas gelatinilytica TaxID=2683194 RepID=UPI00193BEC39|nr:HAMP domain-containing sensor histidine kinase [Anaeromonas gelatinilytica]MBS4534764.1 HAMP domain-containing histidine kinase [Anaeromonas gelatinilytica]